jgi:prepilin-type N-terminal cleavage/methylation domain-containing protein
MKNNHFGFSLIELIAVMGIITTLFGLAAFNLIGQQKTVSVNAVSDTIVSDMSSQQNKAMLGAGTVNGNSYGIYFQPDKYILFKGITYLATDSGNFSVPIDTGFSLNNITFTNNTVVFSARSGEVNGFVNGKNSISVEDKDGLKVNTITVNRYGVVTREN